MASSCISLNHLSNEEEYFKTKAFPSIKQIFQIISRYLCFSYFSLLNIKFCLFLVHRQYSGFSWQTRGKHLNLHLFVDLTPDSSTPVMSFMSCYLWFVIVYLISEFTFSSAPCQLLPQNLQLHFVISQDGNLGIRYQIPIRKIPRFIPKFGAPRCRGHFSHIFTISQFPRFLIVLLSDVCFA